MTDLFTHADSYPQSPGYRNTDTSRAAADRMKPCDKPIRERCLEAIRTFWPMTADEVAAHLNLGVLSVRPRITQLGKAGLLVDTKTRRKNSQGNLQIVWGVK